MAFTTTRETRSVIGDKRLVMCIGTVNIVGDTYNTGLRVVDAVSVNAGGANAIGCTEAAGVLTFAANTGAVTIIAIGD